MRPSHRMFGRHPEQSSHSGAILLPTPAARVCPTQSRPLPMAFEIRVREILVCSCENHSWVRPARKSMDISPPHRIRLLFEVCKGHGGLVYVISAGIKAGL